MNLKETYKVLDAANKQASNTRFRVSDKFEDASEGFYRAKYLVEKSQPDFDTDVFYAKDRNLFGNRAKVPALYIWGSDLKAVEKVAQAVVEDPKTQIKGKELLVAASSNPKYSKFFTGKRDEGVIIFDFPATGNATSRARQKKLSKRQYRKEKLGRAASSIKNAAEGVGETLRGMGEDLTNVGQKAFNFFTGK